MAKPKYKRKSKPSYPVWYYFNTHLTSSQNIFQKVWSFYHALHINVSLKFVLKFSLPMLKYKISWYLGDLVSIHDRKQMFTTYAVQASHIVCKRTE